MGPLFRLDHARRRAIGATLLSLGLLASTFPGAVQAKENLFADWSLLTLPDKAPASFTALGEDGLRIEANQAVAFLYKEIAVQGNKRLAWRWRVDKAIAPAPLERVGQDDRPLAIHVWFPPPAEKRSFFDRLGSLFGYPSIGRVMTYVWGGTEARGTVLAHPHFEQGQMIVLRGPEARTETWYEETVDIAADYRRAFGEAAPERLYIAISADTDDRGGSSSAILDRFRWIMQAAGTTANTVQVASRP